MSFTSIGDLATRLTSGARERRVRASLPAKPLMDDIIAGMASRLMEAAYKQWGAGGNDTRSPDSRISKPSFDHIANFLHAYPNETTMAIAKRCGFSKASVNIAKRLLRAQEASQAQKADAQGAETGLRQS